MSSFFTKKNDKEFGPPPLEAVLYLVVENRPDSCGKIRMCYVHARTGFEARNEVRKVLPDCVDSALLFFPNPVRYGVFTNE